MQVVLIGVCIGPSGHAESSLQTEVHDMRSRLVLQFCIAFSCLYECSDPDDPSYLFKDNRLP
jgi:hypothetical protein